MAEHDKRIFRFGAFEADATSGELRKAGLRLRLQEQPFQVLIVFLENAGNILTREELRQRLWPEDTFVDFDHSLNTIVNKLREVLGDSASNPRFIETIAKRGYRFVASVESPGPKPVGLPLPDPIPIIASAPPVSAQQFPSFLTNLDEVPAVPHGYVRVLFVLIQIMYLSFYIAALAGWSLAAEFLEQTFGRSMGITAILIVSAAVGIPVRLYLLSAVSFDVKDLGRKFMKLFPGTFLLDALWAFSPFLLAPHIGLGLALAATAALIYVPFAQRTLVLMRQQSPRS